jgi:hypothetical protein
MWMAIMKTKNYLPYDCVFGGVFSTCNNGIALVMEI